MTRISAVLFPALLLAACRSSQSPVPVADPHSYANPTESRVTHVDLDLQVVVPEKRLRGNVTLTIARSRPNESGTLMLDTRDLSIVRADAGPDVEHLKPVEFSLGQPDKVLGSKLRIALPPRATVVRVAYSTSPQATGLQWLEPSQTAGKREPFLYSQSESIHARSWIPLQDSPAIRVTYTAHIRTPYDLLAVMSAENDPEARVTGDYHFRLSQPIPPYLIALGVGRLGFQPTGKRSGVYAELPVVARAAREFEDTEKMMEAAEKLYGPYRWGRYDILVLPPSFPFGGMENPRLTTATPTLLAGDKSLVAVIAHELAHSWSGNLVTNATWSDFWLNEGFTTYIERRIQEEIYGRERAEAEAYLEKAEMLEEMKKLPPRDQILHIDLNGRDPDEGSTEVPYGKGMLFLRMLEEHFGRPKFDAFLRSYFEFFAFQSITTAQFEAYLRQHLAIPDDLLVKQWLYQPGMPANTPQPSSKLLDAAAAQASLPASKIDTHVWSTQQWVRFLRAIPGNAGPARMQELDRALHLTQSSNDEILQRWLLLSIQNHYAEADTRLRQFLTEVGRMRYIVPLYEEMARTQEGRARAEKIFAEARPGYHPLSVQAVEQVLKKASTSR